MSDSLQNGALLIINVCFDFYLMVLMLRLVLAWVRADYFNPITRFIIRITQPVVLPLRYFIPNVKNIELSTLLLLFLLDVLKYFLVGAIAIGMPHNPLGILILALADCLKLLLNTFFYAILLQAILSLIQQYYSPVASMLEKITSPFLRPFQRIIPPMGGIDLSPIPALLVLQLAIVMVVSPLLMYGMEVAFG